MEFTEEQIYSLAPDEPSKKSGKELANPSKWGKRELSERALWGECQGSGKFPYQTQVDINSVAFKCSCPSRKFPCKHGLGLLLLYARDKKLFSSASEPDWVTGWLDKRTEKEEKKVEKKIKEKSVDPTAQIKRQENRLKRVEEGISELRLWINDIVRNGLINIPGKDPSYFETMAKRMVDAQAPGLAAMIRTLGNLNFYQEKWQTPFLDQLIRIFLLLEGFPRLESLAPELQSEVKTCIGFSQSQEEIKAEAGLRDDWFVLAKKSDKEENLNVERNWLYGTQSQRYALTLQFYVKGQIPEVNLLPGSCIDAELCYFKGAHSLRALVKQQYGVKQQGSISGASVWNEVMESTGRIMSENPFYENFPVIINNVVPIKVNNEWLLKDEAGAGVTIRSTFQNVWKLMALSGGTPVKIFALGKEQEFEPLGVWVNDQYKLLV